MKKEQFIFLITWTLILAISVIVWLYIFYIIYKNQLATLLIISATAILYFVWYSIKTHYGKK